jgi:hypothetical protein
LQALITRYQIEIIIKNFYFSGINGDNIELDLQLQNLELQSKCSLNDDTNDAVDFTNRNTDSVSIEESFPIPNCNSYLGGCIVENDAKGNENCLCAQISYPIEDTYDLVANKICSPTAKPDVNEVVKFKPVKINTNACSSCNCDNNQQTNSCVRNETSGIDMSNQIDNVIEYKADGTIKIKELFDMDFDVSNNTDEKIIKEVPNENVPFNSCKAVLGKCIVSGNGTIGEGCLCAKMAVDDQPMIEQEIDELTPCPKIY